MDMLNDEESMGEGNIVRNGVVSAMAFQNFDFPPGEEGGVLLELRRVSRRVGFNESFESGRMHTEAAYGGENRSMARVCGFSMGMVRGKGRNSCAICPSTEPFKDKSGKGVDTVEDGKIGKQGVRRETPGSNARMVRHTEIDGAIEDHC